MSIKMLCKKFRTFNQKWYLHRNVRMSRWNAIKQNLGKELPPILPYGNLGAPATVTVSVIPAMSHIPNSQK